MIRLAKSAILAGVLALSALPAQAFQLQDASGGKDGASSDYFSQPGRRYGSGEGGTSSNLNNGTSTLNLGGGTSMTFGQPRSFDADFQAGKERMLSPNQFGR